MLRVHESTHFLSRLYHTSPSKFLVCLSCLICVSWLGPSVGFAQKTESPQTGLDVIEKYPGVEGVTALPPLYEESKPLKRPGEDPCPRTSRLAKQQGRMDAIKFKRTRALQTWGAFLFTMRKKYGSCSHAIRAAYLEAAREVLQPRQRALFQR